MDLSPTITRESAVFPGVKFTLRAMTYGIRSRLYLQLADYRAKIRAINRDREPLRKAYQAAAKAAETSGTSLVFPDDQLAELAASWDEARALDAVYLVPSRIKALFVGIEGFTIAGKSPTAEELIEGAPDELVREIGEACAVLEGLSPDQQGNWLWPTTSGQPEGGPGITTAVPGAMSPAGA